MHRDGAVPEMRKTSTFRHTAAKYVNEIDRCVLNIFQITFGTIASKALHQLKFVYYALRRRYLAWTK